MPTVTVIQLSERGLRRVLKALAPGAKLRPTMLLIDVLGDPADRSAERVIPEMPRALFGIVASAGTRRDPG